MTKKKQFLPSSKKTGKRKAAVTTLRPSNHHLNRKGAFEAKIYLSQGPETADDFLAGMLGSCKDSEWSTV